MLNHGCSRVSFSKARNYFASTTFQPAVRVVSNMAINNKIVRVYVCHSANQFQKFDARIRAGNSTSQLPAMSEEQAIEKGAHLLSEILLFIVASAIAVFQYKKANKNKSCFDIEIESLKDKIEELEHALNNKS